MCNNHTLINLYLFNLYATSLKDYLSVSGIPSSTHNTHSFCIEATTQAAIQSFLDDQIQQIGHWHTNGTHIPSLILCWASSTVKLCMLLVLVCLAGVFNLVGHPS